MAKKAMAAFLLLVIAAWAEMAMAPMFAMHAGHMRPGYPMAADMPAEHRGHHPDSHHPEQQMAAAEKRPCCPEMRPIEPQAMLELVSGDPPCDDPHSCCFRQGPQSVPAPGRDLRRLARKMAPAAAVTVSPVHVAARRVIRDLMLALVPPPDLFGMTLRV